MTKLGKRHKSQHTVNTKNELKHANLHLNPDSYRGSRVSLHCRGGRKRSRTLELTMGYWIIHVIFAVGYLPRGYANGP